MLEVSLHNETITNEEQRAYIQTLKEMLASKLHDSGLLGFFSSIKDSMHENEVDLFVEMNKLRNSLEQANRDKQLAEQHSNEMASQLEISTMENESLRASIKDQSYIMASTKEDLDKLMSDYLRLRRRKQQTQQREGVPSRLQ